MTVNLPICSDIDAEGKDIRKDAACKRVLANRYILAHILHECVPEFKNTPIEVIATQCIEKDPEINPVPTGDNIVGRSNENRSKQMGNIEFDILFDAIAPNGDEPIRLIINLEPQNNFHPGYHLLQRAVYYVSCLIAAQYGRDWQPNDYKSIRKVYSIWLCFNPPEGLGTFISTYQLNETQMYGNASFEKEKYDLLSIIMVGLGEKEDKNGMIDLLNRIFSIHKTMEERKKALTDYGIPITESLSQEVNDMFSYGQMNFDAGIIQGFVISVKRQIENFGADFETA